MSESNITVSVQGVSRAEQNLLLLQSLIPESDRFYVWCYSDTGEFIAVSCPDHLVHPLDQAFRALGGLSRALELAKNKTTVFPRIIGSEVGMQWAVTIETVREETLLFVCGPVLYLRPDPDIFRNALYAAIHGKKQFSWPKQLCDRINEIPLMSYAVFTRYVILVHNALTGEQIGFEDIDRPSDTAGTKPAFSTAGPRNRLAVYQAEQALLQAVRDGNIAYHDALQQSASLSPGVPVTGRELLRQVKTSLIVFTTLVTRAAMEGGLSPEIAYPLGDYYIQMTENSHDTGELSMLGNTMLHDFIYRVHHLKGNPNYSHAVQKCCDYIELSLNRKITAADLAALVGYSEYYLTEKFKAETGKSVSTYLRDARIHKAKILLETTALPIAEISEQLAFATPSYFIQTFRAVTGVTPAKYRKQRTLA